MAETLQNPVYWTNTSAGLTVPRPSRISCLVCFCCHCSVPKSRLKEERYRVYMIPATRPSLSCFSSQGRFSSIPVKSFDCNTAESRYIFGEVEEEGALWEESEVSEEGFAPWRDAESRDVESPSTEHTESVSTSQNGLHLLEETDAEVLSQRVLVLSRTNKVRSALELYKSMELSGLYPNRHACNSLLSCLLRQGVLDDALRVFKSMVARRATTGHSYSLVLKAVADAQGCDSSFKMFVEFDREESSEKAFDAGVYNSMISICGRMDDWMRCEKIWETMKENGHTGTEITYSLLVSIFVRCSQNELALQAYHEMVQNGLRPGNDVMQVVIKACVKEGKWELAVRIFETMLGYSMRPNLITCNCLINSLGKAGEVGQAFKVYDVMKSLGHEPDVYTLNAIVSALYRADRPSDALRLFDSASREKGLHPNLHLYNTALKSCLKLRSWDRAVQILWQLEASGLSVPVGSYNLVIATCEVARKPKVALQVYRHMMDRNCSPDTFTNLSIVRSCIWGSLWDNIEEILTAAPDVSLYNTAIQGMCLRGKTDLAKTLYKKMREKGLQPDGKTRAMMLQKLTRRQEGQKRLQ